MRVRPGHITMTYNRNDFKTFKSPEAEGFGKKSANNQSSLDEQN